MEQNDNLWKLFPLKICPLSWSTDCKLCALVALIRRCAVEQNSHKNKWQSLHRIVTFSSKASQVSQTKSTGILSCTAALFTILFATKLSGNSQRKSKTLEHTGQRGSFPFFGEVLSASIHFLHKVWRHGKSKGETNRFWQPGQTKSSAFGGVSSANFTFVRCFAIKVVIQLHEILFKEQVLHNFLHGQTVFLLLTQHFLFVNPKDDK